jgi:hypothetical protein
MKGSRSLNRNPFSSGKTAIKTSQSSNKLNLYSSFNDIDNLYKRPEESQSWSEKLSLLIKLLSQKIFDAISQKSKAIFNPLRSKTLDVTALLMAEKASMFGENSAETYQLLKLLSNNKPYIALKAASSLEKQINIPENRKIIRNYFNFNPEAQEKYKQLYSKLCEQETRR